ncbi:MAG TPA: hypothetical protein VNV66_02745 [Pilimelia sp.]|nr:hypothetical protein [Pilimelia sp.]
MSAPDPAPSDISRTEGVPGNPGVCHHLDLSGERPDKAHGWQVLRDRFRFGVNLPEGTFEGEVEVNQPVHRGIIYLFVCLAAMVCVAGAVALCRLWETGGWVALGLGAAVGVLVLGVGLVFVRRHEQ